MSIDFDVLEKKYQQLLLENDRLQKEIQRLKAATTSGVEWKEKQESEYIISEHLIAPESVDQHVEIKNSTFEGINKWSNASEKVRLYRSLFKGRDDVYAKRWENKEKEISGYSPACRNEWKPGICQKPKIKCSVCKCQDYLPLNEWAVDAHLRGQLNLVVGIYPLLPNETCWFLAMDFDDDGWQKDNDIKRSMRVV